MSNQPKTWSENPIRKLAEASLETPGMYLMALRTHIARSRSLITDVVDRVAASFPQADSASTDQS